MIRTPICKMCSENRRSNRLRYLIAPFIVFIVFNIFLRFRWRGPSYQDNEVILDPPVLKRDSYENFNKMIHERPKQPVVKDNSVNKESVKKQDDHKSGEDKVGNVNVARKSEDGKVDNIPLEGVHRPIKAQELPNNNVQEEEELPKLSDEEDKRLAEKAAIPFEVLKLPHPVDSRHKPRPKAHHTKCPEENFVILVHSEAAHFQMRRVIRMTWGLSINSHTRYLQVRPHLFRVLFVVGRAGYKSKLMDEARENGDLILLDVDDFGGEHSRKLKAGLQWFLNNATEKASGTFCTASLLLKVNDDTFVNIPAFSHWLVSKFKGLHNNVYMGYLIHELEPNRNHRSETYVSYHSYKADVFPDLIRSPVFLLSRDVVKRVVDQMPTVPLINMEDGYLGLLAKAAKVPPTHNEHFSVLRRSADMCNHLNLFFTTGLDEEGQTEIFDFNKVKENIKNCREPYDHELRDL